MDHSKKMVVVPFENEKNSLELTTKETVAENPSKKQNFIKQRRIEKFSKILKIVLALAKVNGYDSNGQIRSGKSFLPNSDIASLINNAMTPGRVLVGEQEFIHLLNEAEIDPSIITNDNIRAKLINFPKILNIEPKILVNETIEPEKIAVHKSYKREREEFDDDEPVRKKRAWATVESDDE